MTDWENIRDECVERLNACDSPAEVEKSLMILWVGWWSCLPPFKRVVLDTVEEKIKADAVEEFDRLVKEEKE